MALVTYILYCCVPLRCLGSHSIQIESLGSNQATQPKPKGALGLNKTLLRLAGCLKLPFRVNKRCVIVKWTSTIKRVSKVLLFKT